MAKTYLDRSEVLKKIGYVARSWYLLDSVRKKLTDKIKAIPAADVEPVKHGRWENIGGDEWCCDCCGYTGGGERNEKIISSSCLGIDRAHTGTF